MNACPISKTSQPLLLQGSEAEQSFKAQDSKEPTKPSESMVCKTHELGTDLLKHNLGMVLECQKQEESSFCIANVSVNTESFVKYVPEELLGKNIFDLFHPDDHQKLFHYLNVLEKSIFPISSSKSFPRCRVLSAENRFSWCEISAFSLGDTPSARKTYLSCQFNTQAAEQVLAEFFLSNMQDAVVIADLKGKIVRVNHAICKMFGFEEQELIGQNVSVLMPLDIAIKHGDYLKDFEKKLEAKELLENTCTIIGKTRELLGKRKNETIFPLEIVATQMEDPHGQKGDFLLAANIRDISEKQRLEADKIVADLALNSMSDAVLIATPEGKIHSVNHSTASLFGYSQEELLGLSINQLLSKDATQQVLSSAQKHIDCLSEGLQPERGFIGLTQTLFATHKNGTSIPIEIMIDAVQSPILKDRGVTDDFLLAANIRDISEKQQAQAQQILSNLVLENMRDAVMVVNKDGWIVQTNKQAALLFLEKGAPGEEAKDPLLQNPLLGKAVQDIHETLSDWMQHPSSSLQELEVINPTGETLTIEVMATQFTAPGTLSASEEAYTILNARDITEKKHNELKQKQLEYESSLRKMAEQMLGYVNHEIRNPLNGISGFIDLVQEHIESHVQGKEIDMLTILEDVKNIQDLTGMLTHIVNDVLDLRKIQEGKLSLEKVSTPFNQWLEKTCQILKPKLLEKLDVEFLLEPLEEERALTLDPHRCSQILINLLSNAIKFTDAGTITVKAHLSQEILELSVSDSGRGISKEKQELLFQAYQQTHTSDTRRFGGTGLGLYLCKELLDRMEGSISFQSEPGKGSTFFVKIPVQLEGAVAEDQEVVLFDPETYQCPKRFLIVDDSPSNLKILTSMLTKKIGAASVERAVNGQEAVTKAMSQEYDVIFMDRQMPVMGGFEATQVLQSQGCSVPIIGVTGDASEQDIEDALEIGQTAVVPKPYKPIDLKRVLFSLFGPSE